jgi:hypothetical protein
MTSRLLTFSSWSVLIALLAAGPMEAAPPPRLQASAEVARTSVQVGEPVRITIRVQDSEGLPSIDVPKVRGLSIQETGEIQETPSVLRNVRRLPSGHLPASKIIQSLRDLSKQIGSAPGAMPAGVDPQLAQQYQALLQQGLGNINRGDYAVVYLATPEKTGPVTVPAFTVHANGETLETRPIRLTVTETKPSRWVKAQLSLSNPKPFVGDTVNLYVDLLVRRWPKQVGRGNNQFKSQPINHVTLTVPTLEGITEVRPVESLERFVRKRRLPPGQLGYHVNHYPGVILLEQEPPPGPLNVLDPQWYRRRLTFPFRVVSTGTVEIPPLRVAGEVYVPDGSRTGYHWEGFVASSEALKFRTLDVKDRPADYNGTIGPCRLFARASRTEMPAGTPFTLTLREEAYSNLARATPPNLEAVPAFRDRFTIRAEKDELRAENVREFTWTLRPRSETVTEVPAISLSWFDPKTEQFQRVHSDAIPLRVTPAPVRAAPPQGAVDEPTVAEEPSATEESAPLVQRAFPKGVGFLAAFAALVVLGGIGIGLRRRRPQRRQQAARKRQQRQTIEQARQRLHEPALTAADVSAAVQDCLRARLEMTPGEITPEEAAERLRQAGYPPELAESCAAMLRECATRQFAPDQASAANDLASSANHLLDDILAAPPRQNPTAPATVDELTRERQAALTD